MIYDNKIKRVPDADFRVSVASNYVPGKGHMCNYMTSDYFTCLDDGGTLDNPSSSSEVYNKGYFKYPFMKYTLIPAPGTGGSIYMASFLVVSVINGACNPPAGAAGRLRLSYTTDKSYSAQVISDNWGALTNHYSASFFVPHRDKYVGAWHIIIEPVDLRAWSKCWRRKCWCGKG